MLIQLTTTQWLALPMEVRLHLKKVFGVPRSEGSRVDDNKVVSDGHNHRDLAVITIDNMKGYLGKDAGTDDFFQLFEKVLDKVAEELMPDVVSHQQAQDNIVIAKPAEELFITHNGKTYKLIEVTPPDQQPLAGIAPNVPPVQTKATQSPRKRAVRKAK